MKQKGKLIILAILLCLLVISLTFLPSHINGYSEYIFYPLQSLRMLVLGFFPVSFGDVFYFIGGVWLAITIGKWVYYLLHFKESKQRLAGSVLTTASVLVFIYLAFLLGWGINYHQKPLGQFWGLNDTTMHTAGADSIVMLEQARTKDSLSLISFDSLLVNRLNTYAPHYQPLTFHITDERAKAYYRICTNSAVREHGISIKPSLYSWFMERMAVDGYYNPFTGEGQVDDNLPSFQLPFVICHEMAHQAGIAAEGDANLMAYAIGTLVNDTPFNYSCYLNLWLYVNHRLYYRDSALAHAFKHSLNKLTLAHIDTLHQLSLKYNNAMSEYSGDIYDSYLKMQHQAKGIRSYGDVIRSAWLLEQKRKTQPFGLIRVP